ncbi:MAG TPA: biosynthetic arginine decarboxylase [Phycisphaerales bacterium]|nr:biosynthetic arginine decarboxylase [Phycisphaerales bacterium]
MSIASAPPTSSWTIEDSEELYRVNEWGTPYFSINTDGHVTVSPMGDRGGSLDLHELVAALELRNLALPIIIRFPDILEDRLDRLNSAFAQAISRYRYGGVYQGVFPVKCNQQRHLVESMVRFGERHGFGLEAGSKPELMIALALLSTAGPPLICNGYKDREYIEKALLSQKMGHQTLIVLEQAEELDLVLEVGKDLGIQPQVGVRAKLSVRSIGHWGQSVGDRAKFGLTIPEIMEVVNKLKANDQLDCLKLLHFHIGSQISSISVIKDALREACRLYVELVGVGASMGFLDVGGGLAVDYDGSKSNFFASKNYSVQNYANDVVAAIKDACSEAEVEPPTIVSESGRALASHQSILVFDVLGASDVPKGKPYEPVEEDHLVLHNMYETLQSLGPSNFQEMYHDAQQFKKEAISLFNFGYLSLEQRSRAERLYWTICRRILEEMKAQELETEEKIALEKTLASIYYANLSIFRSAPDTWAMDQIFPIMPIHRLDEEPTERATLADLTCDSDGKLDRFIEVKNVKNLLEVHPLEPQDDGLRKYKPYHMGMFLAGAYQEIMGNLHNLFGDTNAVHISMTKGGYKIDHVVKGDTIGEVLSYVQYEPKDLVEKLRQRTEQALNEKKLSIVESQKLLQGYEQSLNAYTYLKPSGDVSKNP